MSSKMDINILPRETLGEILSHLPKKELTKARLVCNEFNYILQPMIFHRISINLHYNPNRFILGGAPLDRFIRDFDRAGLPSSQFTRYLEIDNMYPIDSNATAFGEDYKHQKAEDLVEIISSLENLRGVNWILGSQIHAEVRQGIMDAIISLDNLREFCFKFSSPPPLFNNLRGLTRLVVQSDICIHATVEVACQLQQIIGSSPDLRYLGINFSLKKDQDISLPPLDLFCLVPESRALPLKHLMIRGGCSLVLSKYFFSHIRLIQTLELGHMDSAAASMIPNADRIWKGLLHHRIHLKKIKVAIVSKALLDYMASYSGIEEFHSEKDLARLDKSNEMAEMFFRDVLPPHLNSLRVLSMGARYQSEWSFGLEAAQMLQKCPHLKKLVIGVREEEEMRMNDFLRELSPITTLKHLEVLSLYPAKLRDVLIPYDLAIFDMERHDEDRVKSAIPHSPNPTHININLTLWRYNPDKPSYEQLRYGFPGAAPAAARAGMYFVDGDPVISPPFTLAWVNSVFDL